jgi:hypothetical protein
LIFHLLNIAEFLKIVNKYYIIFGILLLKILLIFLNEIFLLCDNILQLDDLDLIILNHPLLLLLDLLRNLLINQRLQSPTPYLRLRLLPLSGQLLRPIRQQLVLLLAAFVQLAQLAVLQGEGFGFGTGADVLGLRGAGVWLER